MNLAIKNATIDKYFGYLTNLDNNTKKKLISKLTNSIEIKEQKTLDLSTLYGAWDDSRTADEIIHDSRTSRIEKSQIIDFK